MDDVAIGALTDPTWWLALILLIGMLTRERRDDGITRQVRRDQYAPPARVCPHRGRPGRREA